MRSGKRTQEYHFIKTESDALYYAAEIPYTCWGPHKDSVLKFNLIVSDAYNVTPKEQGDWFAKLRTGDMFTTPYLILLTSDTDDSMAVTAGYDLMKRALGKHRVQITGSAGIREESTSEETVFMLTNVYDEAPVDRMQHIRDWCYWHKESFRIICAAGDPTTITRRLKLKFNAVFSLDSSVYVEEQVFG